jgi:integrase
LQNQRTEATKKIEAHDWQQRIDYVYRQVKSELSESNFEAIKKYDRVMVLQGIKKPTRYLHLTRLLSLTRRLKKDWKDVTKEDIDDVVFQIMETYSDDGKDTEYTYDHKKILKIFFRWLKFGNRSYKYCLKKFHAGDPQETEDIVMKKPECKLQAGDLISDNDRQWLLEACTSSRDRALIDMGLDGGLRPGELLTIQIKNVIQDNYGYFVQVNGKTGTRTVRLIKCTPSVARWLSDHPFKNNTEAPMWIILEKTKFGQPLTYYTARGIITRLCDRVKKKHPEFKKRIFLNLFRHTEATNSAKFMTNGITEKRHGWSKNSKMPDRYSHLINADVDDVILQHFGMKKEEVQEQLPIKCVTCNMINDFKANRCSQCGNPLDLETAIGMEEQDKKQKDEMQTTINSLQEQVKDVYSKLRTTKTLEVTEDSFKDLVKQTIKDILNEKKLSDESQA